MNNIGKHGLWRFAGGLALFFIGPVAALAGDGPHMDLPAWDQTISAAKRFVVLSSFDDQAVLDRETALVWERSPGTTMHGWPGSDAAFACANKAVGGRKGWRLPSIHEIASLVDPSVAAPGPTLPAGHPFVNVQSATYWSATTVAALPTNGWLLTFASGDVNSNPKETMQHVWCVRGGGLLDNY